jgi:hypothetical protein
MKPVNMRRSDRAPIFVSHPTGFQAARRPTRCKLPSFTPNKGGLSANSSVSMLNITRDRPGEVRSDRRALNFPLFVLHFKQVELKGAARKRPQWICKLGGLDD